MAEEKCQPEITIYKTCISKDNADIAFYWPSVTHFEMIFIEAVCSKYRGDVEKKEERKGYQFLYTIRRWPKSPVLEREDRSVITKLRIFFLRKWKVSR